MFGQSETTISATDDIGHNHIGHTKHHIGHKQCRYSPHHIGHKLCHVFVRLVNQGGQCAAASQGSGVIPTMYKKLSCCCDSRSYRVQIRSPHTSARTQVHCSGQCRHTYRRSHRMALCRLAALQTPLHVFWDLGALRCLWCVLYIEQKCQKGQIETLML